MLNPDFNMNVIGLLAIVAVSIYAGFRLRKAQLEKNRLLIAQMEREIINNHFEILELQKEYLGMEQKLQSGVTEVSPMDTPANNNRQKLVDAANRSSAKEANSPLNDLYRVSFNKLMNRESPSSQVQY